MVANRKLKVLAVASGGGHWIQLKKITPAFEQHEVVYVSIDPRLAAQVAPRRFHAVCDANKNTPLALAKCATQVRQIIHDEEPDIIVSTGAAPGFFAVRIGKMIGAQTVWIDSLANAERLSLSGRLAETHADLCLTQWPHLAREDGPEFAGAVL
jgi:UDP-N-acetylglucosamine:LPS N-acetylglucosamine transferase